jgi:hypothetical protein
MERLTYRAISAPTALVAASCAAGAFIARPDLLLDRTLALASLHDLIVVL